MPGHLTRLIVQDGVIRRLPTAGLIARHPDVRASAFEHAYNRHPDVRIELVDETRVKQLNGCRHRRSVLLGSASSRSTSAGISAFASSWNFPLALLGKPACA